MASWARRNHPGGRRTGACHSGSGWRRGRRPPRRWAKACGQGFIGELLVARGLGRPQGAPLQPLGDARHERTQIVGIDAGGLIAGNEMPEDEVDLRIAGRRVAPAVRLTCRPRASKTRASDYGSLASQGDGVGAWRMAPRCSIRKLRRCGNAPLSDMPAPDSSISACRVRDTRCFT